MILDRFNHDQSHIQKRRIIITAGQSVHVFHWNFCSHTNSIAHNPILIAKFMCMNSFENVSPVNDRKICVLVVFAICVMQKKRNLFSMSDKKLNIFQWKSKLFLLIKQKQSHAFCVRNQQTFHLQSSNLFVK